MLFGNRYGSYRGNSDSTLSTLILLVLVSFLAYYAYNNYIKKSEEESALTDADEKSIKALLKKYESDLRTKYVKDQEDKVDTDGVCSDNTSKNKYDCINHNRCSIPEIVEEEACLKTAGAKWYPHEWTANAASSAAVVNSNATNTSDTVGTNNDVVDPGSDSVPTDAAVTSDTDAVATDAAGGVDGTEQNLQSGSEGFLTDTSQLLDEPFMAYTSSSSLIGADLTENFMPFSELN